MSTIYSITDKIEIKVDDLVVVISPLHYKVKSDIHSEIINGKTMDAAILALRHGIKEVRGLSRQDGSSYSVEFDPEGRLSDDCVNDLLNIPESSKLNLIAISMVNGIPKGDFIDPETKTPLEGVQFVKKTGRTRKKK